MEILNQKMVKARKGHTCSAGFSKIQKGEVYEATIIMRDGEIYTWKQCVLCAEDMKHVNRNGYPEEQWPEGWAIEEGVGCAAKRKRDEVKK